MISLRRRKRAGFIASRTAIEPALRSVRVFDIKLSVINLHASCSQHLFASLGKKLQSTRLTTVGLLTGRGRGEWAEEPFFARHETIAGFDGKVPFLELRQQFSDFGVHARQVVSNIHVAEVKAILY